MKNSIFNGLSSLVLMGFALSSIGLEVAKAQVSSLKITDSSGREVIVYKESHALVIWAGDYQHWDKLNNIEDEAKEVVAALKRQGFEVTVVANPTGQTLKQAMQTFIANYGFMPDNRLVIFFSGHGYTRKKTKGYLVPIDAPDPASNSQSQQDFLKVALDMEQVESWARQIEAKHVLFVFDSCFSGTIFKQRSSKEKALYIQSVMNKPVRQFLTAGDANQQVPAKSVFTPLFIRALEGEADVINQDGYVTGNELGNYLKQNLSEYTKNQTPQFGTIRDPDLDQGDIVFRALNASQFVAINSHRPTVNPSPVEINSNRSQPSPNPVTTPQPQPSSKASTEEKPQRRTLSAIEWYNEGVDKLTARQYEVAINDFTESIQIDNKDPDAYYNRGWAKHTLNKYDDAILDYNQAIKLKPNFADAYINRGFSKYNLKDYQGAISDLNQAIKLKPDLADAYLYRGLSYKKLNKNQNAINDFRQAAKLYQQQNKAIKLKSNLADAQGNRGYAKLNLGDYKGAISDLNQAIKLKPDLADAYLYRGLSYKKLNKNQNAINDFRQAAKLYQQQNKMQDYQEAINRLKELGVSY
jgi:tetratricopeptide (TPR) repeat protein